MPFFASHPTRRMHPALIWFSHFAILALAALSTWRAVGEFRPGTAYAAYSAPIAVLAGAGGTVSTLACYDPDPFVAHPVRPGKPNPWAPCRTTDDSPPDGVTGNHGGIYVPVDVSGNAGAGVYVQNDYLPAVVRGGYLWAEDLTTGCFNASTSGSRTKVWIYYYDGTGYTDAHAVYYGHIDQYSPILNTWKTWNNYWASSPLWQPWVKDYDLNNDTSGGMYVGTVRSNPSGCVTGSHLHQEMNSGHGESYNSSLYSDGCWWVDFAATQAPCTASEYTWVAGSSVTGRYSDLIYLSITVH